MAKMLIFLFRCTSYSNVQEERGTCNSLYHLDIARKRPHCITWCDNVRRVQDARSKRACVLQYAQLLSSSFCQVTFRQNP